MQSKKTKPRLPYFPSLMSNELPLPTPLPKKGLLTTIFHALFHGEPKNREELLALIRDSEQNALIDNNTRDMLEGVMKIAELRVRDIMVPRAQITTLKRQYSLDECLQIIIESTHSRLPVINDDKDHIEGILIAKDLLPFMRSSAAPFNMQTILRPAVVVPESKRIDRMLKEFRSQHYHLAMVVDEFGRVSGLVTIEDILEQIVGNIEDEYDNEQTECPIRQLSHNSFSVHALTTIEEFNKIFGTQYSDQEVDTIGGLVLQAFGYLPTHGETVTIDGYQFKVSLADSRHLIQLLMIPPHHADPQSHTPTQQEN